MPNNIAVDDVVAASLGLLEAESVMANLVHRDAERGFVGGVGDSVRVRIPKVIEARNGSDDGETTFSDIDESTVSVELTDEAYSAVTLTDRELSFDLTDFGAQVLQPQAAGIARYCEKAIAAILNDAVTNTTNTVDPDNPLGMVAKAAAEFTRREIDIRNRNLVIGPDLMESFLQVEAIQNAAASGSDSAIRGGEIGRVMGFRVYVSPYTNGAVAFTPGAFALACRAPLPPEGAGYAETRRRNGYALRYIRDFNSSVRSDVSLLATFVGATTLDENRYMAFAVDDGGS